VVIFARKRNNSPPDLIWRTFQGEFWLDFFGDPLDTARGPINGTLERSIDPVMQSSIGKTIRISARFLFYTLLLFSIGFVACGEDKVVVRYLLPPSPVELISPEGDAFISSDTTTFIWYRGDDVTRYQLQVSRSADFLERSLDVHSADTTYTSHTDFANGTYFWRVRGENADGISGDWSDAEIRTFYKSDYVDYVELVSSIHTIGFAQDVFLRNDTAYVADGQADLTIIDVQDRNNPSMIMNIDTIDDDFAKGIFVAAADTTPYVFVADMDGKIQALNIRDLILSVSIGLDQNLEDITGLTVDDTLWLFAVSSGFNRRRLSYYQIVYNQSGVPEAPIFIFHDMPADANGLWVERDFAYVACGVAGLVIVNLEDLYGPTIQSILDLEGSALSVCVDGDYAYVTCDRAGVYVVDLSADRTDPSIAAQINTSGRSKDIDIAGQYAFIADGSGGLKVIDISVPDSAHFVAAYGTPYAYGLCADEDYIYVCDRDEGLMIFENRVSIF
jgi:hypothetical protein